METKPTVDKNERKAQLHAIARGYVTEGLGKGNFDAIPYAERCPCAHRSLQAARRIPLRAGRTYAPCGGRHYLL